MKPKNDQGTPMWKHSPFLAVFFGSSLVFAGLCFGFLHVFTGLPVWACALIAIPSGVAVFLIVLWLHIFCDDA
jgi:hypothetical protein